MKTAPPETLLKPGIRAMVREIFSSVQGEGMWVGRRQIFLRLEGCDLACSYCDTPADGSARVGCRIEEEPASGIDHIIPNPVSVKDVVDAVVGLEEQVGPHHSIAVTGGEPLVHSRFLEELLPLLNRATGLPVLLETAGHHPQAFDSVRDFVEFVSMDLKVPLGRDGNPDKETYRMFLNRCRGMDMQVKIVCLADLRQDDLVTACSVLLGHDNTIPVILQPVTPFGEVSVGPSPQTMLAFQKVVLDCGLQEVRVIPQTHKASGHR